MNLTDLQNIDFAKLDIDKYVSWLSNEYKLFSMVCTLPSIQNIYNDYLVRKYSASMHFRITRGVNLPEYIENLYDDKIKHFKAQMNEFEGKPSSLIFFDVVGYNKSVKTKEYIFFSANELKKIKIDISYFNIFLETFKTTWRKDFIDQLKIDFNRTPLQKEAFYLQKASEIKSNGFDYLDQILNGQFIYNLNDVKKSTNFFTELSRIWEITYLEKEIVKLKKASKRSSKAYSLKPNFDDFNGQIEVIHGNSKDLFECNIEQLKNLFSENITPFDKPIQLENKITHEDLRLFFSELYRVGLIRNSQFGVVLERSKSFQDGKGLITSKKLSDAKRKAKSGAKHSYIIKNILSKLNLE